MNFIDILKQGLGITSAQKALQAAGQYLPRETTQPIINAEQTLQNPPMLQLPRFQAPDYLPSTVQYMENLLHPQNIGSSIAESVVNTPSLLTKGVFNTGNLLADQVQRGTRVPLTSYAKSIAPFAEGLLNIGTLGGGAGIAKTAVADAVKPVAVQTFKSLAGNILKGGAKLALEGGGIGAAYGALSGIQQDAPNDTTSQMIDRAIQGAKSGAVAGAIAVPVIGGTLKLGGKLLGQGKSDYANMTPKERQSGFIDPNAPVGEQFKAPYTRGDIIALSKKLDAVLGTEQYRVTHKNGPGGDLLPSRESAFKELEHYASQGDQGAIDALAQARSIASDLANATNAKNASAPVITTPTGKSVKEMIARKNKVVAPPVVNDALTNQTDANLASVLEFKKMLSDAGIEPPTPRSAPKVPSTTRTVTEMLSGNPEPLPWEKAGAIPTMAGSEAKNVGDIAQISAVGNKPRFIETVKRYFGNIEAAKTKGASMGYEARNLPKGIEPMDIIKSIEKPKITDSAEVKAYLKDYRALDNQVFAEMNKAGLPTNFWRDHITHFWNNTTQEIDQAYRRFSQTTGGRRSIPTYEEGIKLGLTPKYTNPAQILAESVHQLERAKAGIEAFKELRDQGSIVPATVGSKRQGFSPVVAPGFPSNTTRVNADIALKGNWYAPTELAKIINQAFAPAPDNGPIGAALHMGSKVSGKIQDITMSGGFPATPANAFTAANFVKEFTAGRIASPIKAFITSLSDQGSKDFFKKNADQIVKMQQRDIPINTSLNIADLAPKKASLGGVWDAMVNDPTFKRFMPALQVNLFNDIEKQALKSGRTAAEAADIAGKAVKQFYGSGSIFTNNTRPQLTKDVMGTFLFAPKFRESMVNFWVNNVKSLAHPLALENRTNVKFLGGAMLTLGAMNYLNEKFNGHGLMGNPAGTQDKLLIPMSAITGNKDDSTVLGIPFLSSIATVPRALFNAGMDLAGGNIGKAAADIGQTGASMLIKPFADIANNQDYFGKPIFTDNMTPKDKLLAQGKYLFNQYVGAHPYVKELLSPANQGDPAYQRLSRAMELPLRFYSDSSINSKYYYANKDSALKGLNPQEQSAFDSIPKSDSNDPNTRILKYQVFLTYPAVFEAKQKIELSTAAQTGKAIDPLYLVNYDTAKKYMRYESLPEGSQDRKSMTASYPELIQLFKARSQFFTDNPIPGQSGSTSAKPVASPAVQAAMDRKEWNYPGVKDYLNANTQWTNQQRATLGLPPTTSGGSGGYQSNKVSNFLKFDKYKWQNLKAKQTASIKKSVKAIIKKRKKLSAAKATTIKLPKIPNRKSITSMLSKKSTGSYKFG